MHVYRKPVVALLLVVNASFVVAAGGQQSTPTAPPAEVAEQAQRWLEIFNSGDFAAMEQFHGVTTDSDSEARERLLREYEIYRVTRGIDFSSMEQMAKNQLRITGQDRLSGDLINLILDTSGKAPRMDGMRLVRSPEVQSARATLSEIEAFDKIATRLSDADEFSGTALVAKDGKTIFKKAWGVANKASGAPNQVDTKLNLASAGKMFTAVAVLQLAQAGKLSLDDKVGKLLPRYDNKDVRKKVTVRHLLTHTSGMGDIFTKEFEARRAELRTVADFVGLFETMPLKFEPGTRWSYSNAGFCLLGAIIEKVSGEDYYEYLDEHIFRPAGMKNTRAFETDRPVDNLAIGYTRMGATSPEQIRDRLPNTDLHNVKGTPAGGSYSTVEDLASFFTAFLDHKLLNEEYTRLAMTAQPKTDSYGLGFGVEKENGHTIIGHGGGFPGISTSVLMYPDDGYIVIVMSNYDRVAAKLSLDMRDWITSQPLQAAKVHGGGQEGR